MTVDVGSLERVLDQGHSETDLVGVPVSLIRAIVGDLKRINAGAAMARADVAMVGVCADLAR